MENILFFLTPKSEVQYLEEGCSIRQALEKMDSHHYRTIPVLSKDGKYLESLSEGDFLWFIKDKGLNLKKCENMSISKITPERNYQSILLDKNMNELLSLIDIQRFVPVVDYSGTFIGIVTRKAVINHMLKKK